MSPFSKRTGPAPASSEQGSPCVCGPCAWAAALLPKVDARTKMQSPNAWPPPVPFEDTSRPCVCRFDSVGWSFPATSAVDRSLRKRIRSVLPRSTEMMGGMSPNVAVAELSRGNAVPRRTSYA